VNIINQSVGRAERGKKGLAWGLTEVFSTGIDHDVGDMVNA
jgi:hypothetical protein